MEVLVIFLLLVFVGMAIILIFILTAVYKSLQFTFTATNLYKKMINREDLIIKLLLDIRDNTKSAKPDEILEENKEYKCPQCGKVADEDDEVCSGCGAEFWSCSSCGALLLEDTTKCPKCGQEMEKE